MIDVVIPANNEAGHIGLCLDSLIASDPLDLVGSRGSAGRIVVVANACTDGTVAEAKSRTDAAEAQGWRLDVLDRPEPGKARALNAAEALLDSTGTPGRSIRVFVDADVRVDPALLRQLAAVLDRPEPAYASGRSTVGPARSHATRAYTRVWTRLPYMTDGVPGGGLFAVNAAGRARWDRFPEIISDDTYVRLQFAPEERHGVPAPFVWPMPEGLANLVKVRRRADAGMAEIRQAFPDLMKNEGKPAPGFGRMLGLARRIPLSLGFYVGVVALVRLTRSRHRGWARGR